jgi:L-ascorbate metabolism protein UlaG (beta-lactamase superfamily)
MMMFKTLFFILFGLCSLNLRAEVTARWLTVASVLIDDGKTRLLFDPAWTRPGVLHWLGVNQLKSDETLVKNVLFKNKLTRVDATFVSHSHFDHAIDAPMVSKLAKSIYYADEHNERLALAYKDPAIRMVRVTPYKKIKVGDFVITPLPKEHSQILHLFDFLPGPVPKDTNLSFWDYCVGDTWFYLIEHPLGNILIDQGAAPFLDKIPKSVIKVDALIQGVANRKNDEVVLEGYVKSFRPKIFIPIHFDNFFFEFSEGNEGLLPGVNLDEILLKLKQTYPSMSVNRPWYGNPIKILEAKR